MSYVVNGGFALWHAVPYGMIGSAIDGGATPTKTPLIWAPTATGMSGTIGVTQKLGVMFLESTFPQGIQTRVPWNVRSSLASIVDGASSTIMMSENTLVGAASPNPYTANLEGNWASPVPTFNMFIGSSAVCGVPATTDCTTGNLAPASVTSGAGTASGDFDGPGWAFANKIGTFENINGGQNLHDRGVVSLLEQRPPGWLQHGVLRRRRAIPAEHDRRHGVFKTDHPGREPSCRCIASRCRSVRMHSRTDPDRIGSIWLFGPFQSRSFGCPGHGLEDRGQTLWIACSRRR